MDCVKIGGAQLYRLAGLFMTSDDESPALDNPVTRIANGGRTRLDVDAFVHGVEVALIQFQKGLSQLLDGRSHLSPHHPSALLDTLGTRGPSPLELLETFLGYICQLRLVEPIAFIRQPLEAD